MSGTLYRKTDAGVDEMATRRNGLDPRARALLILCNGSNSVALLTERIGPPTAGLLQQLRAMGLIEALVPAAPAAVDAGPPAGRLATPRAAPAVARPALAVPAVTGAVDTLRRAWRVLPRLGEVLAAERAARAPAPALQFSVAEADLAATRQRAVAMVEALWGPGGGDRVLPVRRAAQADELAQVLRGLHDAAVVFQGRKRADALMRQVLGEPAAGPGPGGETAWPESRLPPD
ncbi:hypothetical protein [Aquabacterium sp. OR-4]|uniref:hypothetical protein n=1 Tax=Aquabacterium sp. OR-4 TaxID=2978127 RepID=UPI0021B24548|nr:hypothetical protein [Aquabacterium sp. OR-4]MDT7833615.1 hypothetical protein [Aquabacterium sp. OR-4]